MSPPMTRVGSCHTSTRAECCSLLARPLGWARLDSGHSLARLWGEPQVTAPQGLESGAATDGGTRNGLAEARDCLAFSTQSLPACLRRPPDTTASQPLSISLLSFLF